MHVYPEREPMPNYYALIPAAGSGSRMGEEMPKQYLPLQGRPLIYHALKPLCDSALIRRVYVVLAPQDPFWGKHDWRDFSTKLAVRHCGGATRAQSVLNGLVAMRSEAAVDDWVLVHDAARPCLRQEWLRTLIAAVGEDEAGGLLAVPVADTLKRADSEARVRQTEPREGLWQAQTPQMFRYGRLFEALQALGHDVPTDESMAMERLGYRPKLVPADNRNLKVTYPRDLRLAELILRDGEE